MKKILVCKLFFVFLSFGVFFSDFSHANSMGRSRELTRRLNECRSEYCKRCNDGKAPSKCMDYAKKEISSCEEAEETGCLDDTSSDDK